MAKTQYLTHLILLLLLSIQTSSSTTFTFLNKCTYTVWPALLSGATTPQLPTTGFALPPNSSSSLPIPHSWSGRLWARTLCSTNSSTSLFSCLTADCSSGSISCNGNSPLPPATLAEFTLNTPNNNLDFYDVSLVDGYNLPLLISPRAASGNCSSAGCLFDLNGSCPSELRVGGARGIACRSACDAFGSPRYCCSGAYATPSTCAPSAYSMLFKSACPSAYSYAYDDATSTFTCAGADYLITFCPAPAATKKTTGTAPLATPVAPTTTTTPPYNFISAAAAPPFTVVYLCRLLTLAALLFLFFATSDFL